MVKDFGKIKLTIDGEWNINNHYDTLCLVIVKNGIHKGTYCSKIEVPVGTNINNETYWQRLYFPDNMSFIEILQELGERTDAVISQNAVSEEFGHDRDRLDLLEYRTSEVEYKTDNQASLIDELFNRTDNINDLIPNTASSINKLTDTDFVNSSIATNTATFRGLYESVNDLPASGINNNDYAFVIETISENPEYVRYKYNGTSWVREYVLNNSSYTAEQWAAINSGITANLLSQIRTLAQNALPSLVSGYKCTFITFAAYNELDEKDSHTLYFIID